MESEEKSRIISARIEEPLYREILARVPICAIDVLFFSPDKKETLLFKRSNKPLQGIFYTIGGRLLKNETVKDAAVRLARQEAGIAVSMGQLVFGGMQEEIHDDSAFAGVSYHAVGFYYGCTIGKDTLPALDSQHSEYAWFSVEDPSLHPFAKQKVRSLLEKL